MSINGWRESGSEEIPARNSLSDGLAKMQNGSEKPGMCRSAKIAVIGKNVDINCIKNVLIILTRTHSMTLQIHIKVLH